VLSRVKGRFRYPGLRIASRQTREAISLLDRLVNYPFAALIGIKYGLPYGFAYECARAIVRTMVKRTVPLATLLPAAADDNALALQPVAQHAASALELAHRAALRKRERECLSTISPLAS
jgi:hypothetical protein